MCASILNTSCLNKKSVVLQFSVKWLTPIQYSYKCYSLLSYVGLNLFSILSVVDLHFALLRDMDEEGWHCLLDNINSIRKQDQQE